MQSTLERQGRDILIRPEPPQWNPHQGSGRSVPFLRSVSAKEPPGSSLGGLAVGTGVGVGSNRRVVFVLGEKHPLTLLSGGREGLNTVDESEFRNVVASAVALGDRGGVQGHDVLTFISITLPANSALASLQASRKCNKIEGCVLSSRSEEELQKGHSPGAQLATAFQKGPAVNANRHEQRYFGHPAWSGLGLCKKADGGGQKHDLPKQTMPLKIRSGQKSAKVFIHVNEDGRH